MPSLRLIATAAFGLEAVVARELDSLGYTDHQTEDGRVTFAADTLAIARTNLWLRSADRVLLEVARFPATDFGQLFDHTHALPWEDWISEDAAFPIRGKAVKSRLMSVPDAQALVKKAIVERLKSRYHCSWFAERGAAVPIEVSIVRDQVTLAIDTSGPGLHKRGYREGITTAPLKETLAAALVQLSYWKPGRALIDPFCGSGTIPIEAALLGRDMAPGLQREFAAESFPWIGPEPWKQARDEARDRARPGLGERIIATDADRRALGQARKHAVLAGVADDIHFQQETVRNLRTPDQYGCVICNPPYGVRLGEYGEVERVYADMATAFAPLETWSIYVLTTHPRLEALLDRKATRRRKLYNGGIECTYYQFVGPRPPVRQEASVKPCPED
jgi:putative N6-adenine-specific DNA methylase